MWLVTVFVMFAKQPFPETGFTWGKLSRRALSSQRSPNREVHEDAGGPSREPRCPRHMLSLWTVFPSKRGRAVGVPRRVGTQNAARDGERSRGTHKTRAGPPHSARRRGTLARTGMLTLGTVTTAGPWGKLL